MIVLIFPVMISLPGCDDGVLDFELNESFYIKYNVSGGFAGIHNTFVVECNDSVYYKSGGYDLRTMISADKANELRRVFIENNFFGLNDEYLPEQPIIDGFTYNFTVKTSAGEKSVVCAQDKLPPQNLLLIKKSLDELITKIQTGVNAGRVTVSRISTAELWPFYDKTKPEDIVGQTVQADEEIFNLFKKDHDQNNKILYFHGNQIYRFGDTGGYAMPFNTLDYKITVHDSKAPAQWEPALKLSEISSEGGILTGNDYLWLKEKLNTIYYPRHFMEESLQSGASIYEVNLTHIIH